MCDVTDGLCCFSHLSFISPELRMLMTLLLPFGGDASADSGPDVHAQVTCQYRKMFMNSVEKI